ncbi:MAG: hypothetical protein Q7R49_02835 [Candidatus Daviesbacteria bacterium]|nr:hypothetical protein [Candidatus Daviesbacteria bacterium]
MPKLPLFTVILTIIIIASILIYSQKPTTSVYKPGSSAELDTVVNQAKHAYNLRKVAGADLSTGPCLSNDLLPDWVADLVHNPRQAIDDFAQNQCSAYLEGRATHFVELDLSGNVARIK